MEKQLLSQQRLSMLFCLGQVIQDILNIYISKNTTKLNK